jgi:trk system potassium uptake protein TrkH
VPVLIHAVLITLGGLGFVVLAGVGNKIVRRDRRPLPVQVRAVLATSGILVVAGTVLFAACEWNGALGGLPTADRLVNALFQSVTLRTAGFNSVDFGGLGAATALFMMAFMFIGASPGSTGGGIKTTTATVLVAAIRSMARRSEHTTLYRREVPREIVYRSLAILVISGAVLTAGLFLLLLFEEQPFLDLLFETTSAFATVGLSLGATAHLGPAGKLTIIALMFVGRIGPLTLALLLGTGAARRVRFRYPETRLMVG